MSQKEEDDIARIDLREVLKSVGKIQDKMLGNPPRDWSGLDEMTDEQVERVLTGLVAIQSVGTGKKS